MGIYLIHILWMFFLRVVMSQCAHWLNKGVVPKGHSCNLLLAFTAQNWRLGRYLFWRTDSFLNFTASQYEDQATHTLYFSILFGTGSPLPFIIVVFIASLILHLESWQKIQPGSLFLYFITCILFSWKRRHHWARFLIIVLSLFKDATRQAARI